MHMNEEHGGRLAVVQGHLSAAVSMRGSIDQEREMGEEQDVPRGSSVPKLPLSLSPKPSTAKERTNQHDSTSTFADLEDYFARQGKRSDIVSKSVTNGDVIARRSARRPSNATSHYPDDGYLHVNQDQDPFRSNSSIAESNRKSLSSNYDQSIRVEVRTARTSEFRRQAWKTRVRIPTGAPF
jgi:hypothetical protein